MKKILTLILLVTIFTSTNASDNIVIVMDSETSIDIGDCQYTVIVKDAVTSLVHSDECYSTDNHVYYKASSSESNDDSEDGLTWLALIPLLVGVCFFWMMFD